MTREDNHRPDPYANIRSWDDGYPEHAGPEETPSARTRRQPQPSRTGRTPRYGPSGLPMPPLTAPRDVHAATRPRSPRSDTGSSHAYRGQQRDSPPPLGASSRSETSPRRHHYASFKSQGAGYAKPSTNTGHNRNGHPKTDTQHYMRPVRRRTCSPSPSPPLHRMPHSHVPTRPRERPARAPERDRDRHGQSPSHRHRASASTSKEYEAAGRISIHPFDTTSFRKYGHDQGSHYDMRVDKDGFPSSRQAGSSISPLELKTKGKQSAKRGKEATGTSRPTLQRAKTSSAREKGLSPRWQKAAIAALQAGGIAAMNARSQPGAWKGEKGARVATAALDAFDKNASRDSMPKNGNTRKGGNVEDLGGAIGGMIAEHLASGNGSGRHGDGDGDGDRHSQRSREDR